jgi:hypothetical protein
MQAITARDRDAGTSGLSPTDMPYPHDAETTSSSGSTPGIHPRRAGLAGKVDRRTRGKTIIQVTGG